VLTDLGWPLTESEVIDRFVGRSNNYVREQVAARLGPRLADEAHRRLRRLGAEALDLELTAVDGIVEALDAIDIRTCVASSGSHEKMRYTLGRTGLYPRFAGRIFSATEVANEKPAPDVFLHAADRMGVAPRHCVVVEDSQFGVWAARAANMRVFAYGGGVTPHDLLRGPGTTIFPDMRMLPKLLAAHGTSDHRAGRNG